MGKAVILSAWLDKNKYRTISPKEDIIEGDIHIFPHIIHAGSNRDFKRMICMSDPGSDHGGYTHYRKGC